MGWRAQRGPVPPGSAGLDPAWRRYLRIARPDHWLKNVFMLPGTALALLFVRPPTTIVLWHAALALASLCLCSSANYTINEFIDAEFDRFHPMKRARPGAQGQLESGWVMLQYLALAGAALALGAPLGSSFSLAATALLVMGVLYNARPIRTKDWPYLDVLSEAVNNPVRLLLGWFSIVAGVLPPSSILLSYWMGGAFLMAVKRYSELRGIGDRAAAAAYRRSFHFYTEESLLLSAFFYAICSSFFLAVFLIKYRVEFILTFPLFSLLFTWYLAIGLRPNSAAQAPEKLHSERTFVSFVLLLCALVVVLFYSDIPLLHVLVEPIRVP